MPPLQHVDDLAERSEPAPESSRNKEPSAADRRDSALAVLVSLPLLSDPTAPGRARAALRDISELDAIHDDASLVVTELVTNAVKHSGATAEDRLILSVSVDGARVTIQVHDPARTDLVPQRARPAQPGGRRTGPATGKSDRPDVGYRMPQRPNRLGRPGIGRCGAAGCQRERVDGEMTMNRLGAVP